MEDLQMEHGFLKAPWEVLVRNFRAGHKPVVREVDQFSAAVSSLIAQFQQGSAMQCDSSTPSPIDLPAVQALQSKLTGLKRKLDQVRAVDDRSITRCRYRLRHLQARAACSDPPPPSDSPAPTDLIDLTPAPAQSPTQPNAPTDNLMLIDSPLPNPAVSQTPHTPTTPLTPLTARAPVNPLQHATNEPVSPTDPIEVDQPTQVDQTDQPDQPDRHDADTVADIHSRWEKLCLDRALVDYMLREGMYDTAHMLSKSHSIHHIVDADIFQDSRVVIEALRRHDCSPGLRWCTENKRRLQKVSSKLEFRLRSQEFVELARARQKREAIIYMRKHLSANCDPDHLADIQQFMALLAFSPATQCQPYKDMYADHKWQELELVFKYDNYRLHGLTSESTIEILLKAGLASLKTRKCGTDADRKPNCPTCVEPYLTLAQSLPRSRHENSILVCSISGEIMDENNPPMATPQGNVYSYSALSRLAEENDGVIRDPRNNEQVRFADLRKCFIM